MIAEVLARMKKSDYFAAIEYLDHQADRLAVVEAYKEILFSLI